MIKLTLAAIIAISMVIPVNVNTQTFDVPEELMSEYHCMKLAIHYEASGESTRGMIAVANVILNRVNNPKFPKDICSVVKQKHRNVCQFSWYCTKKAYSSPFVSFKAKMIAYEAVINRSLRDITGGALFFHSGDNLDWSDRLQVTKVIGNHTFYR